MPPHHLPSAAIAALSTSETISRNAMPRIMPNDSRRARSRPHRPLAPRAPARARCGRARPAVRRTPWLRRPAARPRRRRWPMTPRSGLRRLSSICFDRLRRVGSHQAGDLREHLAARRVLAEHQPGDRHHDQQHRRQREHGVVRQRRAHAGRVVVHPRRRPRPYEAPPLGKRMRAHVCCSGVAAASAVPHPRAHGLPTAAGRPIAWEPR